MDGPRRVQQPPPGDGPPVREATHDVSLKPDAWPAKAARHQREVLPRPAGLQLNVPGWSADRGAEGTITSPPCIIPTPMPSSQHGAEPQGEPHGSQAGAHGGAIIGCGHGSARRPHGDRNSMKLGRRQLEPPPKQLLHPGAAARAERARARHNNRDMTSFSRQERERPIAHAGRHEGMTRTASLRRRHRNPSSRFVTAPWRHGLIAIFSVASSCRVVPIIPPARAAGAPEWRVHARRPSEVAKRGLALKDDSRWSPAIAGGESTQVTLDHDGLRSPNSRVLDDRPRDGDCLRLGGG